MGVMVTAVLIGIFAFIFMQQISVMLKVQAHSDIQADIVTLKRYVADNFVCPTVCPAPVPKYIAVARRGAPVGAPALINDVASTTPTQLGQYLLRAQCIACASPDILDCSPTGQRFIFEFMRGPDKNTPLNDPLLLKKQDWTSMFDGIPLTTPPNIPCVAP